MFEDRAPTGETHWPGAPPRALLFDLDGTLVDSVGDLHACLNRLLAGRGLPPLAVAQVRTMVGDGVRKLLERGLAAVGADPGEATLDAAVAVFMADYLAHPVVQTRPYPGVAGTLAALHAAGLPMAVCTNKPEAASLAVLDALGLRRYFAAVIGGDSTPRRKPDPMPLKVALDRLGVATADAVMVGDGRHDADAARAAGTGFIGVDYGYGADGLAALQPPPRRLPRFADLPAALGLSPA
ncbi:phosphoglycolate phosphatase [Solimonas variicoloris]|uniref:phosphoglycolate phosphatase n=1 Tax=Solimonas variicoloris TaxID=254408 RepID=UPI0003801C2D|nr:phosphoglycolate phosphatase [Solimonas variicoloris]